MKLKFEEGNILIVFEQAEKLLNQNWKVFNCLQLTKSKLQTARVKEGIEYFNSTKTTCNVLKYLFTNLQID